MLAASRLIGLKGGARWVIQSIRHKGLRRFHATGSTAGIQAPQARMLRLQLAALDSATIIADMDNPGFRLHALVGADLWRWSMGAGRSG